MYVLLVMLKRGICCLCCKAFCPQMLFSIMLHWKIELHKNNVDHTEVVSDLEIDGNGNQLFLLSVVY